MNINSDAVKFFQIIHNVLSNSIKFTNAKGIIEIEIKENDDFYIISLNDNGIGIPAAMFESIFKDRVMGRTGLKGEKSKGMGLSISSSVFTKIMGGEIWFESVEDKGTVFYVQLPKE